MTSPDSQSPGESFDRRLAEAARRLTNVLEREGELLSAMRARELDSLLPEKREATQRYRELMGQAAEQPALLADLDEARKADLKATARRLSAATEANARALTAGIEANQSLVKAIARAVQSEQSPAAFYHANGRLTPATASARQPAVSFNQVA